MKRLSQKSISCLLAALLLVSACDHALKVDSKGWGGGETAMERAKKVTRRLLTIFAELDSGRDIASLCESQAHLTPTQRDDARELVLSTFDRVRAIVQRDPETLFRFTGESFTVRASHATARTQLASAGVIEIFGPEWLAMTEDENAVLVFHEASHKIENPHLQDEMEDTDKYFSFDSDDGGQEALEAAGECLVAYEKEHPGYAATIVRERNLIAYYRLEERQGSLALDSSGHGYHAAIGSTVRKGDRGALRTEDNYAMYFDGSQESQIRFGFPASGTYDQPSINTAAGLRNTVELWVKGPGAHGGMPIGFMRYNFIFAYGMVGFNTGCSDTFGTSASPYLDKWTHFVADFHNGDSRANRLFINGQPVTLTEYNNLGQCAANAVANAAFHISGWGLNGNRFTGVIDEVSVYHGSLPADRVEAHYRAALSLFH